MRALLLGILVGCGKDATLSSDTGTFEPTPTGCPVAFEYTAQGEPDSVRLVGEFNDWDMEVDLLDEVFDGRWSTVVLLEPGAHPYKFVEYTEWTHDGAALETCDPDAPLIQCEEGTALDLNWHQTCIPGEPACASMVMVGDCDRPRLRTLTVEVDRDINRLSVDLEVIPAADGVAGASVSASIDGVDIAGTFDGRVFHVERDGLSATRHTLRAVATDADGRESEPVVVPVWMDDFEWDRAVLYHALIDRVANGSTDNDASAGSSDAITDWAGGDLAGLIEALPYLDSLGVTSIWISNPQSAPADAWPGDCDATYAGYHGFWPVDWDSVDPHLGDTDTLDTFVDAAHARNMRVIMDWVGNHVHSDHAIATEHADDWFNPLAVCKDVGGDGVSNWDRIPESCWFTSYLPDLDHTRPEVLVASVESAVKWARDRNLDGLRVDAAKHMPHSVSTNLRSRIRAELEHTDAGSDFDFYLVGETFDGAEQINAYVGPTQLDGQFDFPGYWALRRALVTDEDGLDALVAFAASIEERYPGGRMSTFLGNLDVGRFVTAASEYTDDVCVDGALRQATAAAVPRAYDRLVLAWTLLFTQPGIPLIYYGDEIAVPGYGDPDNRQPLWWHAPGLGGHTASSLASTLEMGPATVLDSVRRLAQARASHPVLSQSAWIEWWRGEGDAPGLYAYAKTNGEEAAIVILNRSDATVELNNGLAYAGLPTNSTWVDILSDTTWTAEGDALSVPIAPWSARVLLAD